MAGELQAVGDNKYTIAINKQVNQQVFEITRPCNSLLMTMEKFAGVSIRIQHEDVRFNRENVVSDMLLEDYLCLCQRVYPKCQVKQVQVQTGIDEEGEPIMATWYQFLLPLSFNGDLNLSASSKYVVGLYQQTDEPVAINAFFEYYCVGSIGYPIHIQGIKILQSDDFSTQDFTGFDYCIFPKDTQFEYVQYSQDGYIGGARVTTKNQAQYDADIFDLKNDIAYCKSALIFDVRDKSVMTISQLNVDDITLLKVDCYPSSRSGLQSSVSGSRGVTASSNAVKTGGSASIVKGGGSSAGVKELYSYQTGGGMPSGSASVLEAIKAKQAQANKLK